MIAQLKKGVLEFCILVLLSKEELYGYEIMKQITSLFSDTSEQTVYTILRRLLKDGYTQCYTKELSNGPPRKYYQVTIKGRDYMEQSKADWLVIQNAVSSVLMDF